MVLSRKSLFFSLILIPFLGLSIACQKKDPSETNTYLIPWPNAAGDYKLQEVTIETLNSPYVMDGDAAKVYSQQGFADDSLAGRPASVHVSNIDGVYVPQDPESSFVISIYAHFENLKRMEESYQLPTQMDWPRKIGTDVPVRLSNGKGEVNNARYFAQEDLVGITPFADEKGLHMALNAGILAHEHFHAIFERLFMPTVYKDGGKGLLSSFLNFKDLIYGWKTLAAVSESEEQKPTVSENGPEPLVQNQLVLRAWNEGLADFYAYVYTSDPDFMGESVKDRTRRLRRLDGAVSGFQTTANLKTEMAKYAKDGECPQGFCMAYSEGTKLARTLYGIWDKLSEEERPAFFREIMSGLPRAASKLAKNLDKNVMSLESVVPYLISPQRIQQTANCKNINLLLGDEFSEIKTFSECKLIDIEAVK